MKARNHGVTEQKVRREVKTYITRTFLPGGKEGELRDDDLLFEGGIVDSLGAMTMIAFLGNHYGIQILDEDLYPENFASVEKISSFVVRKARVRPSVRR